MPTCNMPACHALMMCVAVGCILRDLFPDPNLILFLTRVNQEEFVAEFNALLQEFLVGTEIQTGGLASAQTREAVARGKKDGTLALSPPGRVMMLMGLVSLGEHHLRGMQVSEGSQGGDTAEVLSSSRVFRGAEPTLHL